MSFNTPVQELKELGEQFHKWRQNNPYRHIPRFLWDRALLLAEKHNINEVSKQIGFSVVYIRRKLNRKMKSHPAEPKFVEVQPYQEATLKATQDVKVRIQQPGGMMAELFFQGSLAQVFPLMRFLYQGESPCSK